MNTDLFGVSNWSSYLVSLTDNSKIKQWLDSMEIRNYTINPDGVVDVRGHVDISESALNEIPIQFGIVTGHFLCYDNNLMSLKGAPKCVGKNFWCQANLLTTLEYAPQHIGGNLGSEHNLNITNLSGIHKHVLSISKDIDISSTVNSHILGLMLIDKIQLLHAPFYASANLQTAVKIINKHLATDRDPMLAQRDLMKAGLRDFARY